MKYPGLLSVCLVLICGAGAAHAAITKIELTPNDVGSSTSDKFSTLPTVDPTVFGLTGADVRTVTFDDYSSGTTLTSQYAALGVTMNSIYVSNSIYGGPASSPNTTNASNQIFTFTVPVNAVGIINTSPDYDTVELWSGPNATGDLLLSFQDTTPAPKNYNIDRFVGASASGSTLIGSMRVYNGTGDLELDELIFQVVPEPTSIALLGMGMLGLMRRRRNQPQNARGG